MLLRIIPPGSLKRSSHCSEKWKRNRCCHYNPERMKNWCISSIGHKIIMMCLLLTLVNIKVAAQLVTNYSFTAFTGTFTALTTPNQANWTGTTDDGVSDLIPIGFDFWYMGIHYTTVAASTNGWITLGTVQTDNLYTNNLSTGGAPRPVIAPLWDDLEVTAFTNVSYKTTGTIGSRVFTLQYLNVKWYYLASSAVCSFQVRLYEGTGKIEFVYRSDAGAAVSPSASIGITAIATGNGNFLSVNNAGTSTSSSSEATITTKRVTGRTYDFTPPVPTAPGSLSFTGIGNNGMTLNWTDLSSNERGFVIYRSTDGVNYSFVAQTPSGSNSSLQSGLSGNTTYFWKVYAVTEGGLSAALSGSQATSCSPPAAPAVVSPLSYCLNQAAPQLTATGSNLLWSIGVTTPGTAGGTGTLATTAFVDGVNAGNNRKTNFTTTTDNVTITSVNYYIPPFQSVTGLVLGIFNNAGAVIATSSTSTTQTAGASSVAITNTFNFNIPAAGNYSIGILSGTGNIGSDNPAFPITEPTGIIDITGVSVAGYRCFNNIHFIANAGSATAPTPSTANTGSTNYLVTQTVEGCVSPPATITVNVTAPDISQVPTANLIGQYPFKGNANDKTGTNNGTLQNAPSPTTDRFGNINSAYAFNGTSQYISTAKSYINPSDFTISIWFKTNSTRGGKLIGFGREQVGTSGQYDRHIYMNNAGQVYFGIFNANGATVNSSLAYNDNNWHLATAVLSGTTGMYLYIDGVLAGANAAATLAENYTGYWRIGYDNLNGWTSQPTDFYFNGSLDDALIYNRALNSSEAALLYVSPDGAGNNGPACVGSPISLSASTVSGAIYAWTGPNSFSSSLQNPSFTYLPAASGTYTLNVTAAGCTSTAYTNVTTSPSTGQWTGNVSTDWAEGGNWCAGVVPTAATDVVIAASAVRMPSVNSSVTCNNLTINTGASLTISATGTLNIGGTFANSGSVTNGGTTNFNGTSGQQTFSGISSFHNLTISNSSGLLLPGAVTINNNLLISSGTLYANDLDVIIRGSWTNNASSGGFAGGTATVTFSGTTAQTIGGTAVTTFNNLVIAPAPANTVTLNSNVVISGNLAISAGTLDIGSFTANRATSGGVLSVGNNATLKIGGTNSYPLNYATNTLVVASTVLYAGTDQPVSGQIYGNLTLSSAAGAAVKTFPGTALIITGNLTCIKDAGTSVTLSPAADISVNGNVSIGVATVFNGGSYTHSIGGSWVNNGTFNGNTSTIVYTGAGTVISGTGVQEYHHLTIAGPQVSFSADNFILSGNLATTGAGSFIQAPGGTLRMTGLNTAITGTAISPDNLIIDGTVTCNASLDIKGNLTVNGVFTGTGGTVTMSGASKVLAGTGAKYFNSLNVSGTLTTSADFSISSSLAVNGSFSASGGTATFTGSSSLSGTVNLYNITVNGNSLQLSGSAVLGIGGQLTIISGILDVTSSIPNTVNYNGPGAQNISPINYYNLILSNGGNKSGAGNTTINNSLTIDTGATFIPGTYTYSIYNDWINYGSFVAGLSTIQFLGTATTNIIGNTTFNNLTINNSFASTEIILENDITASIVNMIKGKILTGDHTLTITNTRTGSGKILGTIHRDHAFATGVPYAFEGPNNTITFSVAASVNSVTVSNIKHHIDDFPFGAAVNEEFIISVPSGTYIATLRLDYEDGELNGSNENSLNLWKYNNPIWTPVGKTGNDTAANYVELSGLVNISGRWAMSDQANVIQWNGSVSTDWTNAANWTVLQGAPSLPPTNNDIVYLGTTTFTHHPVISSGVSVKNIHFGSVQPLTLSLTSGGSLAVGGSIEGDWSGNAVHTIAVNDQLFIVNEDLHLSDGTPDQSINLLIGAGAVHVKRSLITSGNAGIIFSSNGSLNIHGDFIFGGGQFSAGSGTVVYEGDANQLIAGVTYNNLTIDKAEGLAEIHDSLDVLGNVLITSGELDNYAITNMHGNVSISSGTTMQNFGILHVKGNWLNQGTYIATGASIFFDGDDTQTISASVFNNFNIVKPVGSTAILEGNVTVNGNLTVASGTLDMQTFDCNRSVPGGIATLGNAGTILIGANNAPANFNSYKLGDSSTVVFNGTAAQTLLLPPDVSFGHLTLQNTGVKSLGSPIAVKGNLTIGNGTVFDAGDQTITLFGHWLDSGIFNPSSGTVICNGTGKNISGNTTFNKVTVFGSYTILNDVTFNDLLNITSSGSLSGGSGIHTLLHGDMINRGVLYTLGTTTYSGNKVQTLSLINAITTVALTVNFNGTVRPVLNSTSAPQFGFLNINNTGGINPSVNWTILYSLAIGTGAAFNGGSSAHNILGAVSNNGTITSNGILNFIPTSAATVDLGNDFSSTGTVRFGGAGAMTLTGNPDSFHNVIVTNTNAAGITPSSGWKIKNDLIIGSNTTLNAGSFTHLIGGNLSDTGVINSAASTFILNGSGVQEIYAASSFNNLTINKPAGATLQHSDISINGVLNFISGKIQTGAYLLIQNVTGTITGAGQNSGWVFGGLNKRIETGATAKIFEVGDSLNFTPVSVAFASVTTAGDLTASTTRGDHPAIDNSVINATKSVNRFWTLSDNGIVFTTYNATFNYAATDVDTGVTAGSMIAGRYSDGSWTYPSIGLVTSTSIEATGLTTFMDFQIGQMNVYVKTWDGGAGTNNWGDAANWNVDGVPSSTDNVELTGAYIINIDVPATTNNLLLNNTNLVLTNTAGNSLTVSGNFTLTAGTFNTETIMPAVSGTLDLMGGTVGFTGNGTQAIPAYNYYNLASSAAGSRILAGDGVIGIAGSFMPGNNAYTIAGSTVDFNGPSAQTIAGFNYNNLVLSNSGEKYFSGTVGIAGTLSLTESATANAVLNSSTISYNGAAAQMITDIAYYNLDASNNSGVVSLLDAAILNNFSISSGTVSIGNDATVRAVEVNRDIIIGGGATLNVASASNATHLLSVKGNISNNGTLNLRPDANSLCNTTFNKNGDQTISGNGAVTSFNLIHADLGDNSDNRLNVTATNFSAPAGFLTLSNGSFNLNSADVNITPFTADITTGNFLIPATAGLSVNAGTINSDNMNWTIAGLVKVAGGVMNIGSAADNVTLPKNTALFDISGGTLRLASRISNPGATWELLMKGGTMIINTQGSTVAGEAPFNMDATGATLNVSGGIINIQNAGGSAGENLGYYNRATAGPGFTGGTLQMGNGSTASSQTMIINSSSPVNNLSVEGSNTTALLQPLDLTVLGNVTIAAGALNINGHTLKIGGAISNSGIFNAGTGKIEMNGTEGQVIPAGAFAGNEVENLTINNSEGVTINGPLQLTGILLASGGQLNANGNLTLISTAAKTALIDGSGAGTVTGNVTMQRYLATGFGYKYFSSPFQSSTVNEFSDDLNLGAAFPAFYRYNEDLLSSGWVKFIDPAGVLNPGEGYAANFGTSLSPKTVDVTGVVNNNTVAVTLYNHNRPYTLGFNLVGNPYPSPVDWNASSGWSRTGIDDAIYYFDNGTTDPYTGTYSSYINGISSNGIAGNIIAAMQGFFVHVSDGAYPVTATMSINNNARINNLLPDFHRPMPLTLPLLRISAGFADERKDVDHAVIYFDNNATSGFDQEMDALKLMNTDALVPSLYTVGTKGERMSICAWPGMDDSTVIPLGLKTTHAGWITFHAVDIDRIPVGRYIYIYDAKTGIRQNLQENPRYRLMLDTGRHENRFFLVFQQRGPALPTVSNPGTFDAYVAGGNLYADVSNLPDEKCDVVIVNMLGQVVLRKRIFGNGRHNLGAQYSNGIFIVSFYSQQQRVSKKVFISH